VKNVQSPHLLFGVTRGTAMLAVALTLAACSKEEPPKVAPPAVVQPATPPEAKAGGIRSETSAPAPEPMLKIDPNAELAGKVKSALRAAPGLGDLAVDVVAADGAVTLFGTADTRNNIEQAGKVASGVPGVKSVQNKIVVVRGS
jgi:hyperosmotically inducible periplasmic protein